MNDSILKKAFKLENIPHEATTGRFFNKITMKNCNDLQNRVSIVRNQVWDKIDNNDITLDFDSSVQTVYGNQEGAAKGFNSKTK